MTSGTYYYAHAKPWYGTKLEHRDIQAIKEHFGVEPTNPADIGMPLAWGMEDYEELAASRDVVIYRPIASYVAAGICRRPRPRSSAAGSSSG